MFDFQIASKRLFFAHFVHQLDITRNLDMSICYYYPLHDSRKVHCDAYAQKNLLRPSLLSRKIFSVRRAVLRIFDGRKDASLSCLQKLRGHFLSPRIGYRGHENTN